MTRSPRRGLLTRAFLPAPAPSAPAGPSKISKTRRSAARTAPKLGKAKLKLAIDLTREVLRVPADYRIGIVPASDTGAVEMALWSLLGARGVDVLAWESFGEGWVTDIVKQLKLADVRALKAPYGELARSHEASISTTTSSSPGTARRRACACRTPTGSPPTARG